MATGPGWLFRGRKVASWIWQLLRGEASWLGMLILWERVAGLRRWLPALPWHCLVLPAPLAAIKQQMHLLGQITHCRIQARIPIPVGAGTAAAATLRLGKSLREAPGGGWAAGLDPAQAPARCPSPHQSHRGRSVPSRSSSSSWPSTPKQSQHPKQPQHPETAPRWGRLGDVQLFQQPAGIEAPHPN